MARSDRSASATGSLAPGAPGLGAHMGLADRALARGDFDAAAELLGRVPHADLSPFLRNEAAANRPEGVRFLLARGARARSRFPLGEGRVEVGAGACWDSHWQWTEAPAGYGREPVRHWFGPLDAAIFAGAAECVEILLRAFPGSGAQRSPVWRVGRCAALRALAAPRATGAPGFGDPAPTSVSLPNAAMVFAFSQKLEGRPDLAHQTLAALRRDGADFFAAVGGEGNALTLACRANHPNLAMALLSLPERKPCRSGPSALSACVLHNELAILEMLLDAGESPNWAPGKEPPPLWTAIEARRFEAAELLLARGARADFSRNGATLAQRAAERGFGLPAALLESSAIALTVKESERSNRKKDKKAFAKQKRELAEREGVSVEEAAERLRAQKAAEAARAAEELAAQGAQAAQPSMRRRRRL